MISNAVLNSNRTSELKKACVIADIFSILVSRQEDKLVKPKTIDFFAALTDPANLLDIRYWRNFVTMLEHIFVSLPSISSHDVFRREVVEWRIHVIFFAFTQIFEVKICISKSKKYF